MGQGFRTQVLIEPGVYIEIATMLLVIPISWVFSWFCAVLLHEFCHCLSLYLLGYRIFEIRFRSVGAEIICSPTTTFHGILCTAAGPVGSLFALLFSAIIPQFSLCALFQTVLNLIPVFPLDGGRIVRFLLSYLHNDTLEKMLCITIEWVFITIIAFLSIMALFWLKLGILPLCIPLFLLLKAQKIKIPCKQTLHRVQ